MRYSCSRLVSCHLPLELYESVNAIADSELLSRSQVLRDAVLAYVASRQDSDQIDIRSKRNRLLQGDIWGKLFDGKGRP